VPQAVVNVFDFAVIIQVEDLTRIGPDPEVEAAHSKRAASCRDYGMRRTHVTRHPSAAGEIVPLGHFFNHAVTALLPGEAVRAGWRFLADRRGIEVDYDFLTDEMQSSIVHILWIQVFKEIFAAVGLRLPAAYQNPLRFLC